MTLSFTFNGIISIDIIDGLIKSNTYNFLVILYITGLKNKYQVNDMFFQSSR